MALESHTFPRFCHWGVYLSRVGSELQNCDFFCAFMVDNFQGNLPCVGIYLSLSLIALSCFVRDKSSLKCRCFIVIFLFDAKSYFNTLFLWSFRKLLEIVENTRLNITEYCYKVYFLEFC